MPTPQAQALLPVLAPVVAAAGAELEDVSVKAAGKRWLVRIVIDGADSALDLDAVAEVSRAVDEALEGVDDRTLPGAYTLEVTTPGIDRPLTLERHWRRAVGRLVEVRRDGAAGSGGVIVGRVTAVGDGQATLDVKGADVVVPFADVRNAVVQVEFSRGTASAFDGDGGS
ncbi:MAG TPA: ribosome maturation factor RimP [Mycobacteriales bacterium]|nr:ribosome maturation factor RimP [Mycobacteriales bacterium]